MYTIRSMSSTCIISFHGSPISKFVRSSRNTDLTATLSKLNLNIASAHVATFGERVVDVFYVTDLLGAQITSPTRQAAIKRALLGLFPNADAAARASKND